MGWVSGVNIHGVTPPRMEATAASIRILLKCFLVSHKIGIHNKSVSNPWRLETTHQLQASWKPIVRSTHRSGTTPAPNVARSSSPNVNSNGTSPRTLARNLTGAGEWTTHVLTSKPVADPGSRGAKPKGGDNQINLLFDQISPKMRWEWRILDRGAGPCPEFCYVDPLQDAK